MWLSGRCVRKGMDCTPHIPVRVRKAQADALGTFNRTASLFLEAPKIEAQIVSPVPQNASEDDIEAASALLGLFGVLSSAAASATDTVTQPVQRSKRRLSDEVTYSATTHACSDANAHGCVYVSS